MTPDLLDDLLDRSAPATRTARGADLRGMITDARVEVRPVRRTVRAPLIVGGLVVLLTGGAGVAVAADLMQWEPWAEDPVGAYTYTLPSGIECEMRLGNFHTSPQRLEDDVERDLEAWFDGTDVLALARERLPEEIEQIRAGTNVLHLDDGTEVDAGYGTEHYDADHEYMDAMGSAVGELVWAEVERLGYADIVTSYEGNGYCPGLGE
ncbi:hypothetical protein [Microbacterium ulmi]|uniref:Uncharacterized protein n=1 Tax=Microbacterium ulmi TaxID=179095 RepID=A0A7Y2LYN2_9MICO|nr:hypothetical protein [Microbacterium ulmi]NII71239.1 hypothetical protein [Microbacterium ulmi]NNH02544.1 hypothetical protein [Microbacterium ulmi]